MNFYEYLNKNEINQYYIKNIDRYEMSEEISNICAKNGIAVANAIKINNRYINKVEDFYIMVFNYIEGEHIDISNIDENHIIKIAKMLGKIHKIKYTDNYKKIIRHSIDWDKFIKLPDFNNISYKEKYIDNYKNYNNIFDKVINIKNLKKEKLGICHRDIKTSNVIWKDNNPYLIDFESSRVDDIQLDFIETMLRWTGFLDFNIDYNKVKIFVNEYKKYIDVSDFNYTEILYANLIGRFDFLYYNLDITLIEKTNDVDEYSKACQEVVRMIDEINYYLENINNISEFLNSIE